MTMSGGVCLNATIKILLRMKVQLFEESVSVEIFNLATLFRNIASQLADSCPQQCVHRIDILEHLFPVSGGHL